MKSSVIRLEKAENTKSRKTADVLTNVLNESRGMVTALTLV